MKVFITGMGVVSSIGNNVSETLTSLLNEKTGLKKKSYPDLNADFMVGEVNLSDKELATQSNFDDAKISRSSLLGIKAATECWGENKHDSKLKTGIVSGTSVGGMDRSEMFFREVSKGHSADYQKLIYHDSGNITERIADKLEITGYVNTISTACSSSSNAIMHGARLIKAGKLDRVLVGGVDALSEFTISGFKSLMIYNENWISPFDENRQGLNLGEGAGFLLLESEKSQKRTGNKVLAQLSGYNNSSDAYHQTATSPNAKGATIAIEIALKNAGLKPSQIDYINAHGTGTKNNDLTESIAFKNVFGSQVPAFSSTKSYTGHTLAASGAIVTIFSVLSINHKVLFPNLNYKKAIEETGLIPISKVEKNKNIKHILSNAFGFGGNCTSLVISKIKD